MRGANENRGVNVMGGKGSGRRKGDPRNVGPPPEARLTTQTPPASIDADFNHRSISLGLELMALGDIDDWSDPEVLIERFNECLRLCEKWDIRPMVSNVALGFGVSAQKFQDIAAGRMPRYKGLTRSSGEAIQKAYEFLHQNLENNLVNERGNPVKWIFLGKNYFGLTDQTEKIVRHVDEKPELPKGDNVTSKYASLVGAGQSQLPEAEIVQIEDVPEVVIEENEDDKKG